MTSQREGQQGRPVSVHLIATYPVFKSWDIRRSQFDEFARGNVAIQKAKLYSNNGSYRNGQSDGRPVPQPKRRGMHKPAEGWMGLVLLAIALYSGVTSIVAGNWVYSGLLLLWMPVCGLLVGLVIAKIPRFPQSIF